MPEYQLDDGVPVDDSQPLFSSPKERAKSKPHEWAITGSLVIAAIITVALPYDATFYAAIVVAAVATAVHLYWLARHARSSLKSIDGGKPTLRAQSIAQSFPSIAVLLLAFTGEDSFYLAYTAVGMFLGALSYLAIEPLLIHLARPFDSIESRAERDAAAICFVAVLPILYAAMFVIPTADNLPDLMAIYAAPAAFFAFLGAFMTLRQKLVAHRS